MTLHSSTWFIRLMPVLFVWLWSTGFIGAKYALPYAEPFTLLLYRMLITLLILSGLAWYLKPSWPDRRQMVHVAIVGLLVHGLYLGGVFYAILGGMPAGLASLIVGLQPLVTALMAVLILRETVGTKQWLGLLLGLLGVSLVLLEKMGASEQLAGFPLWTVIWVLIALGAISVGTVYQKRYCQNVQLIPGTLIQYCAAALFFLIGAAGFETGEVHWNQEFIWSMAWLVLALSIGAILLLMALIRQGAASQVASLFYLVPPVTAFEAFILFDERLGLLAMCGGILAVCGVALVVMRKES